MPDAKLLGEIKKKAEDALRALETKKLKGEIPQSEYEAWKRELTKDLEKINLAFEGKNKSYAEEEDRAIDSKLEAYSETQVEAVLKELLEGSVESIAPVFDWKSGSRYPRVEENAGLTSEESKSLLEKLCDSGSLQREFHDVYIKCPKCSSFSVRSRLSCPSCGSSDIVNGMVIGHFKCGYADFADRFNQENKYVCPKCKGELKVEGVDYQKPGIWFKCQACNKFFPTAMTKQSCNDCGALFGNEDATLYRAPSYKLSSHLEKGIVSGLLAGTQVKESLAKVGLKLESPFISTGNSGEKRQFMMGIIDTNAPETKPIVVDIIASDDKVDLKEVVAFFAKACDVDASCEILVGLPAFNEEAKKAASSYGVLTVEATERQQITSAFIKLVESITQTNVEQIEKEIVAIKSALGV